MEILIAVIIIGVLAVIMVPVLNNRVKEARLAACERDMEEIAEAQRRAAIQLSAYLRLYVLDDVRGGDDNTLDTEFDVDGIADESLNTGFFDRPEYMFIDPEKGVMMNDTRSEFLYNSFLNESSYNWPGPFYTIHRDDAPVAGATFPNMHDIPNDPWGNDYLLFLRGGVLVEPDGIIQSTFDYDGITYDADIFDRPTILSMGPDGMPGDSTGDPADQIFGKGDDLFRSFEY